MKLDANALRYMSKEEYRTLQAVELGQKNVSAESANGFIFAYTCSQEDHQVFAQRSSRDR